MAATASSSTGREPAGAPMTIHVCWRWVGDDQRWGGVSDADRAALEIGLRLAEARHDTVDVIALGPVAADEALRQALAAGATTARRIDASTSLRSEAIAEALATAIRSASDGPAIVVCGDYSMDRGSGAVPAFLADALDARQALGLIAVDTRSDPLVVVRRLDGGRRERLEVEAPAVISVEGSVARLRRASLTAELAAAEAIIETLAGPIGPIDEPAATGPYRPRARVLPAPSGTSAFDRIRMLTGGDGGESGHGETVVLEPAAAAARILDALTDWGYRGESADRAGETGRVADDASGRDANARHNER